MTFDQSEGGVPSQARLLIRFSTECQTEDVQLGILCTGRRGELVEILLFLAPFIACDTNHPQALPNHLTVGNTTPGETPVCLSRPPSRGTMWHNRNVKDNGTSGEKGGLVLYKPHAFIVDINHLLRWQCVT